MFHFDRPRLVIRGNGVALCRETEFGIFFPDGRRYVDPVSGLEVVPDRITRICLHQDHAAPPSIEIEFREEGFACAIYPGGTPQSRASLGELVNRLAEGPESSEALRAAGAARWLDECLEWGSGLDARIESILKPTRHSREFLIDLSGLGFSFAGPFRPNHVDAGAGHLRVSDCRHRTVLYTTSASDAALLPGKLSGVAIRPC
ncbi:MAG: hypothetical protein KDM63_19710 [Verrucomicrobiae bacterium]|nr:hypothetical protein [Verrucomicrobiae bacterium]